MGSGQLADLSRSHAILAAGGVRLAVHGDWRAALPVDALLADAPLERWGQPRLDHGLVGRAAIHVLGTPAGDLVAKRLSRGGLLGRLLPDLYWDPSRPFREAALAEGLRSLGLSTPAVAVARSTRVAGLHRHEIASVMVPRARDLADVLKTASYDERLRLARATGRCLRKLHDAGLDHRDLQVKNLLLQDSGALWILDLDGCRLAGLPLAPSRADASLARFARSLVKRGLLRLGGKRGPAPADVRAFWEGYGRRGGRPRSLALAAVHRRLRHQLIFHRPFWLGRRG